MLLRYILTLSYSFVIWVLFFAEKLGKTFMELLESFILFFIFVVSIPEMVRMTRRYFLCLQKERKSYFKP